jgi:hypothetical protein
MDESRRDYSSQQAAQTGADNREHSEKSYSVKDAGTRVATANSMFSEHTNSQLDNITIE